MRISGNLVAALCAVAGFSAQPAVAQEVHTMVGRSELEAVGSYPDFEVLTRAAKEPVLG